MASKHGQSQSQVKEKECENDKEMAIRSANVNSVHTEAERDRNMQENKSKLIDYIRENVIGANSDTILRTAYGEKPHVYVDYTASGKSLKFIEDYI